MKSEIQKKNQLTTEVVIVMKLGKRLDITNDLYLNFNLHKAYFIEKINNGAASKIVLNNYVHNEKGYKLKRSCNYRILENGTCPFIKYQCS